MFQLDLWKCCIHVGDFNVFFKRLCDDVVDGTIIGCFHTLMMGFVNQVMTYIFRNEESDSFLVCYVLLE